MQWLGGLQKIAFNFQSNLTNFISQNQDLRIKQEQIKNWKQKEVDEFEFESRILT